MKCSFCGEEFDSPRYTGPGLAYDPTTCSLTCTNKARRKAAQERARIDAADQSNSPK